MATKFVSYLEKLRFDPKLLHTRIDSYISNVRLVVLLIASIVCIGTVSYFSLPRRLNPEVKIPIVTVATVIPGASTADMESLVTVPLEDKISGVKGLDTMTSSSRENVSVIVLQFLSSTDRDKAKNDVQALVDQVTTLPSDAQKPSVQALDFENQPVWTFAVTSEKDDASLMLFSKKVTSELKDVVNVDHVVTTGFETQEVHIIADVDRVREFGLNPVLLSQALKKATASYPSGTVETDANSYSLTIDPTVESVEDIRNIRVFTQGKVVRLDEIATVQEEAKPGEGQAFVATKATRPHRAVIFDVYKKSTANIDQTATAAKTRVEELLKGREKQFSLVTIQNSGEDIAKQFGDLVKEFRSTIILVFLNLLLFLGIRQAIIASTTIPLTFLSALAIMNILGMSLNFLSLFAFLLALGLAIDDTIVTVSAMTTYYKTKRFSAHETGLLVWRDFIVPLWSTTIATIWAFVPLLITSGIIGEFIKPIPVVVTATMMSSTTIAVLITLPLMMVFLKLSIPRRVKILGGVLLLVISLVVIALFVPEKTFVLPILFVYLALLFILFRVRNAFIAKFKKLQSQHTGIERAGEFIVHKLKTGLIDLNVISKYYQRLISRILSSPRARITTVAAVIVLAVFSYLLIPLGFVTNEFFPKTNSNTLYVSLQMPTGTNLSTTSDASVALLDSLRNTPELVDASVQVGVAGGSGFSGSSSNSSVATITLNLTPKEKRQLSSVTIAESLRKKYKNFARGTVSVSEETGGPPAGADIQIKLLGSDLGVLDRYADKLVDYLKQQRGMTNVEKSIKTGTSKLVFVPDNDKLAAAGISPGALGLWMRTFATGFTLDQIKLPGNGNDQTDVVFRMSRTLEKPENIGTLTIQTMTGEAPLLSLGELKLENNPAVISREDRQRTISVTAGVLPGFSISQLNKDLEGYAGSRLNLPNGYTWKTGGVNEENAKSVQSIFNAMGISFLLILITMVIEFKSYRQAAIILFLIPLAISGVFIVFGLTGTPLSFPALIGVLALFGIVVTNAIVIVEKINQNRDEGMVLKDAIVDAAQGRLEPIALTSITSILGLVPITLSDPLWRGLGGAIIAGLSFAGLIMLFFVPIAYYYLYKSEE